jgi:hypothetical protein
MRARTLSGLAGAAALICASRASAEPLGSVAVVGECPSAELVKAALERRHLPAQAGQYGLTVRAVPGGAEVSLTDAANQSLVTRRLDSDDCGALAEAAALIAETYFVELLGPAPPDGGADRAAPESAGGPQKLPSAASGEGAAPRPPPAGPTRSTPAEPRPPPPIAEHRATGAETPSAGLVLALGGGADWLPEPGASSGVAQGVLGLSLPRAALDLELYALTSTATTLLSDQNRVSRLERRLVARIDRRFALEPSLSPWAGVGVAAAQLKLIELTAGPNPTQYTPTFELGVTLREPIATHWSLRAELGCRVLGVRERYQVNGGVEIGSGPRGGCTLAGGLEWSSATQ